jgi:hypothetical protein
MRMLAATQWTSKLLAWMGTKPHLTYVDWFHRPHVPGNRCWINWVEDRVRTGSEESLVLNKQGDSGKESQGITGPVFPNWLLSFHMSKNSSIFPQMFQIFWEMFSYLPILTVVQFKAVEAHAVTRNLRLNLGDYDAKNRVSFYPQTV